MPPPPLVSPVTGSPCGPAFVHASTAHFRDVDGRHLLLRGINLSSSAKSPVGQPGAKLDGFWETAKSGDMSFVGRVLDLTNGVADLHLLRLRNWGFNCLRYVVNWESLEHAGPGNYDHEYVAYTVALLRKCKEYDFFVYIDPHQDLFSRFAGGSGAPYWTLIACGLEPENFTATNAACIECEWPSGAAEFPAMIWASNYSRLACQTLFTLWAAGRDYAPLCIIDGVNIQDWLEAHYFAAMKVLGAAILAAGDLVDECVLGWDSLNEPNHGFLGTEDIREHSKDSILRIGPMPTAFEGMRLGMGQVVQVERWKFSALGPKRDGQVLVDPQGKRAWLGADAEVDGVHPRYGWTRSREWQLGTCVWALHGVWDVETNRVLLPDYFGKYRGEPDAVEPPRKVEFGRDYWLPHWKRWAPVVRSFHPDAIHFVQTPVFQVPPIIAGPELQGRVVHSSHFYDGLTLVTKHWNWFNADALGILRGKYPSVLFGIKIGEPAIRKCMRDQLGVLRQDTFDALGQFPTMMSEIGVPYDLDHKKAYVDGNYTYQTRAMDASLNACDGTNLMNYSIWTYCPDNSHEYGDLWNGEDLSLWSIDDAARSERFRASTSQLDLSGRIPKTRARAHSQATSLQSTRQRSGSKSSLSSPLGSRRTTPNISTSRLASLSATPLASSVTSFSSTLAPPLVNVSTTTLGSVVSSSDIYAPISLNDGARAIAAFCRPYPTKAVGVVQSIDFDIRTSCFALSILVIGGDYALGDAELATEVYLPLIHYAKAPHLVSQLVRDDARLTREQAALARSRSICNLGGIYLDDTTSVGTDSELGTEPISTGLDEENTDAALALDVTVSTGRWETEGQIFRWFYDIPSGVGDTQVVTLQIKRQGGAIPAWVHALGDVSTGSGFKAAALAAKELLCPPDTNCVVS